MSATRPELHVVRDPGPQGAWLEVLGNVETALHEPPSFSAHVVCAFAICGLCGALAGSAFTILCLRLVGAL